MKTLLRIMLTGFLLSIIVSACAHLQAPISADEKGGVVEMTASNFKFEPNNITARTGDTITFKIRNVSGSMHNFTLKDPDGGIMQTIDLPSNESVTVKVTFAKAGTYPFYYDKTGHSTLGMEGQVVTTGK